ncbi:hypothetical protein MHY85_20960, partial [Cellulomonas sp. ACRRI]|uniref:hypothetical protein n=1 Tax=Cellulomonas sp. ACRRI TaxID=2918188 RepID=UPI001EF2839B
LPGAWPGGASGPGVVRDVVDVAGAVAAFAQPVLVAVWVLSVPWSRGHRGLSYALTGAGLADARDTGAGSAAPEGLARDRVG